MAEIKLEGGGGAYEDLDRVEGLKPQSNLDRKQLARIEALEASHAVQSNLGPSGAFAKGSFTSPDAIDLVNVARYIMTGEDPWDDETAEERREGVLRVGLDD